MQSQAVVRAGQIEIKEEEILLYIGSSARKDQNGKLKVRVGVIKDRLTNGYHPSQFGLPKRIKRYIVFPQQMKIEEIDEIRIYWLVTFDNDNFDFPIDVESLLRTQYLNYHETMPSWHK